MVEEKGEGPEDVDTIGIYVGGRNADGERHGEGWAVLPNGDFYTGCYCRGMRNGKGLYVFKNGARYEGEWRRAMKYGVGQMIYPDGSRYEGDWKHDLKQGFGAYSYPNGDIYEGAWFKGKRHGLGTYFYADSKVKFMGTWIEGTIEGSGQIIYPRYRYHGSWVKGMPKGTGCFVFDTDCMQHGFHLLTKDPNLEEYGEGEEEKEEKDAKDDKLEEGEEETEIDETLGKISVWRARNVTAYMAEFLPPEPVPLPVHDSIPSLTNESVETDLLVFEPPSLAPEYEGQDDNDSWLLHRQKFLEETEQKD
ncbi:radial spoke head 1 homolog [Bombyx mandarina]|uniref:Radial spoke head 1 homolog n=2 Tax=Bombyx TaxID=7090 RepID=A0A8R2HQ66_BOMMO|nr:radial spoke head 1 homolog [Bombyx mori]XP_021204067.1 radial spoke head 1 homolog [Bombyx mori]XP_028040266.1 radial spoke head 1 homolog [Bombyx mandarina]